MKFTPLLAVLLFALWSGLARPAMAQNPASNPPAFFVANWNVENLFDTVDDPDNPGDDEFLPNNPTTRWTQVRYDTKLDNLAQVISQMNNDQGPDILGIEEVENEDVLRDLVDRIHVKPYGIVHVDSPDPRGIDTAMIFNRDHFALQEFHAYKVPLKWGRSTRDILHAVLEDHEGRTIHVLVNHWPSRGGGPESEYDRFAAARTLAGSIGRILQREPAARIVILGDFNDTPTDRSIRDVLDVEPYPSPSGSYETGKIYNLASGKAKQGQGSFYHAFDGNVEWRMYDQIMASGALLQNTGSIQNVVSLWVDKPAFMVEEHGQDKGAPVPTFENMEDYQGGYSDHFPVGARFANNSAAAAATAAVPLSTSTSPPAAESAPVRVQASVPEQVQDKPDRKQSERSRYERTRRPNEDWVSW